MLALAVVGSIALLLADLEKISTGGISPIAGPSAAKMLTSWKVWLVANNATVMFILLLFFGVLLVGAGLGALIG